MKIRFPSNIIECVWVCLLLHHTNTAERLPVISLPYILTAVVCWYCCCCCRLLWWLADNSAGRLCTRSITVCWRRSCLWCWCWCWWLCFFCPSSRKHQSASSSNLPPSSAHQSHRLCNCCLASRFAHTWHRPATKEKRLKALREQFTEYIRRTTTTAATTAAAATLSGRLLIVGANFLISLALSPWRILDNSLSRYLLCHLREIQLAILVLIKELQ